MEHTYLKLKHQRLARTVTDKSKQLDSAQKTATLAAENVMVMTKIVANAIQYVQEVSMHNTCAFTVFKFSIPSASSLSPSEMETYKCLELLMELKYEFIKFHHHPC